MAQQDSQIDAAVRNSIEQVKSHGDVMKKARAHHEALHKHSKLQQKHAAARAGGNPAARPHKGGKKGGTRKRVSAKQE